MDFKRILTTLIGLPIVVLILIFGNTYIIDVLVALIACIALREYFKCCSKEVKCISWVGYVFILCMLVATLNECTIFGIGFIIVLGIPTILLLLFLHIIISDMKISLKDIAFTFLGIMYIVSFIFFIPLIYSLKKFEPSGDIVWDLSGNEPGASVFGKYLIWYVIIAAWGTDICAYLVGKYFGEHKFSKVSPNKTIEGCIGGVVGAIILTIIYTFFINTYTNYDLSYLIMGVVGGILSVIGQIGDFSASTIKRYFEVKDFSHLFPGHGGMIDRIDSVLFISPYAFFIFCFIFYMI